MAVDHVKEITKLLQQQAYRYDTYDLFRDSVSCAALSISNAVDLRHRAEREQRYMDIVGRYDEATVNMFPKVMEEVGMALDDELQDVLGKVFHELELHNKERGQFFTPAHVAGAMAQMAAADGFEDAIAKRGYIRAHEPAVGSGVMVIALAESLRTRGINYQTQLHVTAVDVDERAAHMAYVQLSLLHIPAEVIVGDTLTGEVRDRYFTPAHILGGWTQRLAIENAIERAIELEREAALDEGPAVEEKPSLPAKPEPRTIEDVQLGQEWEQPDLFGDGDMSM